jgi:antagonist of KipI
VSDVSDRMGCRLKGPQLALDHDADVISEVIPQGVVEVTGAGLPIVMLADRARQREDMSSHSSSPQQQ